LGQRCHRFAFSFFFPLMVSIFGFFYHYILHADIRSPIIFRVFSKACIWFRLR
jgi:hypothetical protein